MNQENENVEKEVAVQNNSNVVTPVVSEQENIAAVEQTKLDNQVGAIPVQPAQQTVQQNVTPQQVGNVNVNNNVENNQEQAQESQVINPPENNDNKGPSTFSKIATILLFIFLFAFVYFLGDITEFVNLKMQEKNAVEITSGKLICESSSQTKNLDINTKATFTFENKEVISLNYIITSTGDKTKDKEELDNLHNDCEVLKKEVESYDGVSVVCSLNNGVNSVKQTFDYKNFNAEDVKSSYSEAGGIYPQFKYKDDIKSVESKMIASDYTCEKISD